MTRNCFPIYLIAVVISMLTGSAFAQKVERETTDSDRGFLARTISLDDKKASMKKEQEAGSDLKSTGNDSRAEKRRKAKSKEAQNE